MVEVYFDYGSHLEIVARFLDEGTYNVCIDALATLAEANGAKLVESVTDLKLEQVNQIEKSDINSKRLELACNLAHSRTLHESGDICNNEDDMYVDIDAETLVYKEEIQDRFNNWYDYFLTEIEKIL